MLEGELTVSIGGQTHTLTGGGYVYAPAGETWSVTNARSVPVRFQWIRKRYEWLDGYTPKPVVGNEKDITPSPMPDTDGNWRTTRMLDPQDLTYDMHVNVVTFEPGTVIPFAETHVMEHGLYMLQGKGVYRLNDDWVEVEAGDYLSLRAFCPQACYAGGPEPFRYLLYKDVNRQVTL